MDTTSFRTALQKGLGRTLLYVKAHGLANVADVVLEACLHDQAYDPQCEPSKAGWLFEMFANSPYYDRFRASILDALMTETDTWDLQQLFDFTFR